MKIDENNFIFELKNKNPKALDYIYTKYVSLAYKIAFDILKNTGSHEDIEECVSDIFFGIWKNASKYNSEITTFSKWFISVSKYKAIDYLRKLRKTHETIELEETLAVSSESTEDNIFEANNIETIHTLIKKMKPIDKQIFVKRYISNENIPDIAEALGIKRSAVDNRLTRGKKFIRNKWKEILGR